MLDIGDNQERKAVEPETPAASPEVAIQDPASSTAETAGAAPETPPAGPDLTAADADKLNELVFGPEVPDVEQGAVDAVEDVAQPARSNRPRRDAGMVIASTLKGMGGKLLRSKQLNTAAAVWADGSEDLGGYAAADFISADVVDLLGEFEFGRQFLAFLEGSDTGGLLGKVGSLGVTGLIVYQAMSKAIQADVLRIQQGETAPTEQ